MTYTELPVRLAGRVLPIDPSGRVLLFRYDDRPPKGRHWATPGGGLEPDEDFYAAACRELAEETGWPDVPVAPDEVHREEIVQWSRLNGLRQLVCQHDHYFVGRVTLDERPLGEVAAMHVSDGILESRWWTPSELDSTQESIWPRGLSGLLRRLG
ncbi:MAG TPA: NUDIX domain-containing protein [Trebonia sp.]